MVENNDDDFQTNEPDEDFNSEDEDQKLSEYYTKRRLQQNQMERKVRRNQMRLNRLRSFVRLLIIALLIFIGYKIIRVHQWYLPANSLDSFKDNKRLEIVNNKIVPSYKILAALRRADVPKVPIYMLKTDDVRTKIMQLDPIDEVFIRRFWFPARLQIIVEEKTPILTVSPNVGIQPVAFFTSDGKIIGRDYLPLSKNFHVPLILAYPTKGNDYRNWTLEKISTINKIVKAVEANSKEPVEYIDVRKPEDVFVKIKTVNIRLGALDDTVFNRINRLPSILPQIKLLDKPVQYVDLRWKNTNYIKLNN